MCQLNQPESSIGIGFGSTINIGANNSIAIGRFNTVGIDKKNSILCGNFLNSDGSNSVLLGNTLGSDARNSILIGQKCNSFGGDTGSIILNATENPLTPSKAGVFIDPMNNSTQEYLMFYNPATKEVTYGSSYVSFLEQSFSGVTGPAFGVYRSGTNSMGISINSALRVSITPENTIYENVVQQRLQPVFDYRYATSNNQEIVLSSSDRFIVVVPDTLTGVAVRLPQITSASVLSGTLFRVMSKQNGVTVRQNDYNVSGATARLRIFGLSIPQSVISLNAAGVYEIMAVKNANGTSLDDTGAWYIYRTGINA
jgi:hypothetical protein